MFQILDLGTSSSLENLWPHGAVAHLMLLQKFLRDNSMKAHSWISGYGDWLHKEDFVITFFFIIN